MDDDDEHRPGPEEDDPGSRLEAGLRFREILDQLPEEVRPLFPTPKPASPEDSNRSSEEETTIRLTDRLCEAFNSINDFADLLQQNAFLQQQQGPRIESFDWRRSAQVPRFFLGPQGPREWPILGAFSIAYCLASGKPLTNLPFFKKQGAIDRCFSQAWVKSARMLQDLHPIPLQHLVMK